MPVVDKIIQKQLSEELRRRTNRLFEVFECRELNSSSEGVKGRGSWVRPDTKCATIGNDLDIRMAVDDFKNILAELKKLK